MRREQARHHTSPSCSLWAIATVAPCLLDGRSQASTATSCVGTDPYRKVRAVLDQRLSLRQAKRSSLRCRHRRCCNSSAAAARRGAGPACSRRGSRRGVLPSAREAAISGADALAAVAQKGVSIRLAERPASRGSPVRARRSVGGRTLRNMGLARRRLVRGAPCWSRALPDGERLYAGFDRASFGASDANVSQRRSASSSVV
jgi:hypothetical protein